MFYIIIVFIILSIIIVIINKDKTNNDNEIINPDSLLVLIDIKEKIKKLISYCYLNETNSEYKLCISRINDKIDTINIYENIHNKNNSTSYTINKGDEMAICLRSKKDKNIHDLNEIMYVVIHEISHIACPEIGHTKLFLKINKYFL
jgi:hypothetical protein